MAYDYNQSDLAYHLYGSSGGYQFTSLENIVEYFMFVYVGEDKIIPKVKKIDVAFHAQRAMQELSFDTFKSLKAYEITVPSTLTMPVPHDYVNYTKVVWSDAAGIEHIIYPTSKTSNPQTQGNLIDTNDSHFTTDAGNWTLGTGFSWTNQNAIYYGGSGISGGTYTDADGVTARVDIGTKIKYSVPFKQGRTYRVTFSTSKLADNANPEGKFKISIYGEQGYKATYGRNTSTDYAPQYVDDDGSKRSIYLYLYPQNKQYEVITDNTNGDLTESEMLVFEVVDEAWAGILDRVVVTEYRGNLNERNVNQHNQPDISATWSNYSSATPSENQNQYDDDTYWPMDGSRFGLDPQHSQGNGSFYIDPLTGLVHFSSNLSGKTVIIKYISDGLGTYEEMQVHKFAEEAMYKWISHAVLASKANTPEYLVARYKKERSAAIRTAKLRLSNIKLEEITQILRGKSKQIKH